MSDAKATLAATFAPEQVPAGLRSHDSWICWRVATRDGEPTKLPVDPATGDMAKANDPDTWGDFRTAVGYHNQGNDTDGIGFVFSDRDDIVGVDLDDCRDPETGEVEDWAAEIVETLDSFTEVSPSGTGFHVFVRGTLDDFDGNRSGGVEVYGSRRFFTVTGDHVEGTPQTLRDRQDALEAVHGEHIADDSDITKNGVRGTSATRDIDLSDQELVDRAMGSENGEKFRRLWDGDTSGYPSQSEADLALCNLLAFWTGGDAERIDRLFRQSGLYRGKWDRDDYRERTIEQAISDRSEFYDPSGDVDVARTESPVTPGGFDVGQAFIDGCREYEINPDMVKSEKTADGERVYTPVTELVKGRDIGKAVFQFAEQANVPSGTEKQAVVGHVVLAHLRDSGEFFVTPQGTLFYFDDDDKQVYRVDGDGRATFSDPFAGLLSSRYRLLTGRFSRNLGTDIYLTAKSDAPEREVYRFACFDHDSGELYVSDFSTGYYAICPGGIEHRHNGADVFFLSNDRAEGYQYLTPDERPPLPDVIPGEIGTWRGAGDPIMRLFGNRSNYAEGASLGPSQQRKQLYIHLHTLPFIDVLTARPVMVWVGPKGSGKTAMQRAIGRFVYGSDFTESVMPDSRDDFLAKVSNQALAFLDNYDDAEDWVNDVLAAIATGSGVDKRQLFTTNELHQEVPRCWLSITSRDLPDRRDDVADRLLIFRVDRLDPKGDDGPEFVGMGTYLRQIDAYRDILWSAYLDNLRAIVATYHETDTEAMSSAHRMADWAIMARVAADALDVSGIDDLLAVMQTERAAFALENEDWAQVLGRWVRDDDTPTAGTYQPAKDIAAALNDYAEDRNLPLANVNAQGLGSRLNQWESELRELYGLDIKQTSPKEYRFAASDAGTDTDLAGYQ